MAGSVSILTFFLYHATLLPGLDLGDTASFQAMVGSPFISPRDGYPLYFALAGAIVHSLGSEPAYGLNLVSAMFAAVFCGVFTLVAAEISGSVAAGAGAALLLAGSYTFWSQSVIAEVYTLHLLLISLTLWLLLRWAGRPTIGWLALFFAVYAAGFGNHLSMILLLPAYAGFLLVSAPRGWRTVVRPRVVGLAIAIAALGAMPYLWNLRTLWLRPFPPATLADGLRDGWFDITKSDWRDTMVLSVPRVLVGDHLSMYAFDLRQQFGWPGIALAFAGLAGLFQRHWRRAALVLGVYVVNAGFAFSYNVGDTHVFYLPSHAMVALLTAVAAAVLARRMPRAWTMLPPVLLAAYAGLRIYVDYPALDRSEDWRPTEILERLTAGLDDRQAVLLTDLNWQLQNGLTYFSRRVRSDIAYTRMPEVLLYAPALVTDNVSIGRQMLVTRKARESVTAAYGPLLQTADDPRASAVPVVDLAGGLPAGTRYVLTVLKPTRDYTLDAGDLLQAISTLTAGRVSALPEGDYLILAGRVGSPPDGLAASNAPFRQRVDVERSPVTIRMDSWLAADTIRRMGFGHVIVGRRHTLIVERGVSFAAFDESGHAVRRGYAAGIYEPQPRYLCYR